LIFSIIRMAVPGAYSGECRHSTGLAHLPRARFRTRKQVAGKILESKDYDRSQPFPSPKGVGKGLSRLIIQPRR